MTQPTQTPTPPESEAIDLTVVDDIVAEHGSGPDAALPVLQAIQSHFRYLPPEALERVCDITEITRAQIAGVSTFYGQFRHKPMGERLIRVCHGTACHVAGAPGITDAIRRELGIEDEEEDTDSQMRFTVENVACIGCCSLAPCLTIEGVTYGRLTVRTAPLTMKKYLEEYAS